MNPASPLSGLLGGGALFNPTPGIVHQLAPQQNVAFSNISHQLAAQQNASFPYARRQPPAAPKVKPRSKPRPRPNPALPRPARRRVRLVTGVIGPWYVEGVLL